MDERKDKKTDEELVLMAQDGNEHAMETLLVRFSDVVRGTARKFFLVDGDTDDLVQEGMIGLYKAVVDFRAQENGVFRKFAKMCVTRRIIDAVKASSRKKNSPLNVCVPFLDDEEPASTWLNPEEILILSDDVREFRQLMGATLSDFEFKVATMYMDGMTCAEICEATGKSAKSVDNAVQRSRRKLLQVLKK